MAAIKAPEEVEAIVKRLRDLLSTTDEEGRRWGSAKCGVYLFWDYDGEPIYVGQTRELLSGRIGRHLTGGRSDSVAKFVLDPFEVAEVQLHPMWELQDAPKKSREVKDAVDAAEWTLHQHAIAQSRFGAILNEKPPPAPADGRPVELPPALRGRIIPDDVYERRKHPDIRIARRAYTIANLARIISERKLREPSGLRDTLAVQAQRLEHLTRQRADEVTAAYPDHAKEIEFDDPDDSQLGLGFDDLAETQP